MATDKSCPSSYEDFRHGLLLYLVCDLLEDVCVFLCQLRESFAIQCNVVFAKSEYEFGIAKTVFSNRCVNRYLPCSAEDSLFLSAITEGILTSLHYSFFGWFKYFA